jgi:rhodanese-related sulfurtransferase
MRTLFMVAGLVLIAGCKKDVAPREVSVAEAAAQFNAGTATPVDANTPEYREGAGWVPGAVLLTDFADYPLSELPQDKGRPLVFYCTSRM